MDLIGQMASVGAVLGLLGLSLWWLRRRGFGAAVRPRRGSRHLEALERLALGPQHTLHLVRLGDQVLLVACSPAGCVVVANRPWRELGGGLPS